MIMCEERKSAGEEEWHCCFVLDSNLRVLFVVISKKKEKSKREKK